MDSEQFDNLIKRLETTRVTRGGVLRGVVASAMAAVAGAGLIASDTEAKKKRGQKVKSQGAQKGKVTICHFTHSETNPYNIITVSRNSVQEQSHLSHGDFEYNDCCLDSDCSLPDDVDPQCNEAFCDQGTCGTRFVAGDCNDDLYCTVNDHCVNQDGIGVCTGTARDCSALDNLPCISGVCNENTDACEAVVNDGASCSTGDICLEGETCQTDGSCGGGTNICGNECESSSQCGPNQCCCKQQGQGKPNRCVGRNGCEGSQGGEGICLS